eukprot:399428_1
MLENKIVSKFKNPPQPLLNTQTPYIKRDLNSWLVIKKLQDIITPNVYSKIYVLWGPKNIGKSTLIGQIVENIYDQPIKPCLLYCSFGTGTQGIVQTFDLEISQQNQFQIALSAIHHDLSMAKEKYPELFWQNGRESRPTLILDEVDFKTWSDEDYDAFIGLLKDCYDKGLMKFIIVTSSLNTVDKIMGDNKLYGRASHLRVNANDLAFNNFEIKQ